MVAAGLLLLAAAYLWLLGGTTPAAGPAIGGPFELTADNGATVTNRDFRGRYMLIYFGYTECPDICPLVMSNIAEAMKRLGALGHRVQPLFITVDPKHDTPAVLNAYVHQFDPSIIGLTGTPAQIQAVEREFRIIVSPDHGTIDHSAVLFVIGPGGRYVGPLSASDTGAELARGIAADTGS